MKPWCQAFLHPSAATQWRTVLFAARHHPEGAVRDRMNEQLRQLLGEPGVEDARQVIETVLRSEPGTPLEPFALNEEDLALASRLASISLQLEEQTRFRVISQDALTDLGGLVLTQSLRHYMVYGYRDGKPRRAPANAGRLWPAQEPTVAGLQAALTLVTDVTVSPDAKGFAVRIALSSGSVARGALVAAARAGGVAVHASGRRRELSGGDLRIEVSAEALVLRPARAEALMRLDAAAAGGAFLTVGSVEHKVMVALQLLHAAEAPVPVRFACACAIDPLEAWLDVVDWPDVQLGPEDQVAIGRWLTPQWDWNEFELEQG